MEFVVLDFETGSNSAIEIGLARFVDGVVADTYSTFIKPLPGVDLTAAAFEVHGIRRKDLKDAPVFSEIYKEILNFCGGTIIAGHNTKFDLEVLCATAASVGMKAPEQFSYVCTMQMAKRLLSLKANKLANLAEFFGVGNDNAHRALSDAIATGMCLIALLEHSNTEIAEHVMTFDGSRLVGQTLQTSAQSKSASFNRGLRKAAAIARGHEINSATKDAPKPFLDKNIVISGDFDSFTSAVEGQELIMAAGGTTQDHVNKQTDILVLGRAKTPTTKHKKALHFQSRGSKIEIIDESEFIRRLNSVKP